MVLSCSAEAPSRRPPVSEFSLRGTPGECGTQEGCRGTTWTSKLDVALDHRETQAALSRRTSDYVV